MNLQSQGTKRLRYLIMAILLATILFYYLAGGTLLEIVGALLVLVFYAGGGAVLWWMSGRQSTPRGLSYPIGWLLGYYLYLAFVLSMPLRALVLAVHIAPFSSTDSGPEFVSFLSAVGVPGGLMLGEFLHDLFSPPTRRWYALLWETTAERIALIVSIVLLFPALVLLDVYLWPALLPTWGTLPGHPFGKRMLALLVQILLLCVPGGLFSFLVRLVTKRMVAVWSRK